MVGVFGCEEVVDFDNVFLYLLEFPDKFLEHFGRDHLLCSKLTLNNLWIPPCKEVVLHDLLMQNERVILNVIVKVIIIEILCNCIENLCDLAQIKFSATESIFKGSL